MLWTRPRSGPGLFLVLFFLRFLFRGVGNYDRLLVISSRSIGFRTTRSTNGLRFMAFLHLLEEGRPRGPSPLWHERRLPATKGRRSSPRRRPPRRDLRAPA